MKDNEIMNRRQSLQVYFWLLKFLHTYRWKFITIIVLSIIISLCELSIPKFIQYFIDVIFPLGQTDKLLHLVVILLGIIILMLSLNVIQKFMQRTVQEKVSYDIQFAVYQHLRYLGVAYFEKTPVGRILSLMNSEVAAVQNLYRRYLPSMIRGTVFAFISIAIMVSIHIKLSLIIIPCFLLYYLLGPFIERKASINKHEMTQYRIQLNQKAYESISAIAEHRANASEKWDIQNLLNLQLLGNKSEVISVFLMYLRGSYRRFTYYLGGICIFIYGSHLVLTDGITVGAFVAFILYYFAAMQWLTGVVTSITEQSLIMNQAKTLYDLMHTEPEVTEAKEPIHLTGLKGEIAFREVSFSYPGEDIPVLNQLNLRISASEHVALVGTSGSGKSTLLKLIDRFYEPTHGKILLDGIPLNKLSNNTLRNSIGFVFQEIYLFGASVKENIRFGKPEATDEEIVEAAKSAYAHDFIMELPQGYDTPLGERGYKLSGGQKQRISLARMFVKNPPIVLLDEATSSLDNTSELKVKGAFEHFLQGKTVVTVAHRLSTVMDYDRMVVLQKGRIVEEGTFNELMARKRYLYHMIQEASTDGKVVG